MMRGEARFHKSLVRVRQRRVVQFDHAPNEELSFFEGESGQRFKNLRKAHCWSLAIKSDLFNACHKDNSASLPFVRTKGFETLMTPT